MSWRLLFIFGGWFVGSWAEQFIGRELAGGFCYGWLWLMCLLPFEHWTEPRVIFRKES